MPFNWRRLSRLRHRTALSNMEMARRVLGPAASTAQVRALANYFSRIIAGRVPHVSARSLYQLALGLGFESLSAFFFAFESAGGMRVNARHRATAPVYSSAVSTPVVDSTVDSLVRRPATLRSTRKQLHDAASPAPTAPPIHEQLAIQQLRADLEATRVHGDEQLQQLRASLDRVQDTLRRLTGEVRPRSDRPAPRPRR